LHWAAPVSEAEAEAGSFIRVALVDDQALFRSGLKMLIDSQPDLLFCGEADNGEAAVALAAEAVPDVMLMDLRMPVLGGVAATARITAAAREEGREPPRLIALTTFNRDAAVVDAVAAGASGYVLKSSDPEFLLAAIRTVHSGYSVIAPGSVHDLFRHAARTAAAPVPGPRVEALAPLSPRERDVFLLVAKGWSNAEIAAAEFVAEATVKSQIRSILAKLGLLTRIQLVAYAYENRLMG